MILPKYKCSSLIYLITRIEANVAIRFGIAMNSDLLTYLKSIIKYCYNEMKAAQGAAEE